MPTKKVTPKVTKTSAKKVTLKPVAKKTTKEKRALICAPSEQCFWTTDGRILANLAELSDAFNDMAEDVFMYHVTKERNDFAEWIEHVLLDAELAEKLRKLKKVNTAREAIVSRLRIYSI